MQLGESNLPLQILPRIIISSLQLRPKSKKNYPLQTSKQAALKNKSHLFLKKVLTLKTEC
jgi:hypothetical protein